MSQLDFFFNPKAYDLIIVMKTNSPLTPSDVIRVAMAVKFVCVCACVYVCVLQFKRIATH